MSLKSSVWLYLLVIFCTGSSLPAAERRLPKTLVLIICSDNFPVFPRLQRVWKSYMHNDREHFECYFIRSKEELSAEFSIRGDVIWSRGKENVIPGILNKTLLSLEALGLRLDEFDYVLRSNLSSFFVFPRLLDFLTHAPREGFYCGIHHGKGTRNHGAGWVNGSGIIMSRDLVRLLLANKASLFDLSSENKQNVDDMVMGDFFAKNGVKIQSGRYQVVNDYQTWLKVRDNLQNDLFHFRVKTPPPTRFEVDLTIHAELLQKFYGKTIVFDEFFD